MSTVAHVLGEFVTAWNAGRRPRLREYLERVQPADRDELAEGIQTFLAIAPEPEYPEDAWAQMRADPSVAVAAEAAFAAPEPWPSLLPRLRARTGLSWADVATRLGIGDRRRVAARLEQMEAGTLDPAQPTWPLLERLARVLGVPATDLDWRGPGGAGAAATVGALRAQSRSTDAKAEMDLLADLLLTDDEEPDEVDALFLGGRE
jgi:transcriptional regulator with XRE-family HTH domain